MGIVDAVSELVMELEESQNQRDKRVENLWRKLDPQGHGELDLNGLQKGLRKIDHPLKNADDMLRGILKKVDTNGDGKIQYEEFRTFVEATEHKLLLLFKSINRGHDGRLAKDDLQAAFKASGITVPQSRLAGFFDKIDMNHDGYITFQEWRNFLLFMPVNDTGSPLEAALSYYSAVVSLNAEGDSLVTGETLEGLGTTGFLLQTMFGSIFRLVKPNEDPRDRPPDSAHVEESPEARDVAESEQWASTANDRSSVHETDNTGHQPVIISAADLRALHEATNSAIESLMITFEDQSEQIPDIHEHYVQFYSEDDVSGKQSRKGLTSYLPESGYFIAGALAGGISRTATAPLDRLKVFLIVNTTTTTTSEAVNAAKSAQPVATVKKAAGPIGAAVRELWKAGGIKTFFAGNGLNVVKIMPETAIKFGSYEAAKRALAKLEGHEDVQRINPWSKFLAGGLAGMTAQFCVYPLDTLKFRMQSETVKGGLTGNALIAQTARKMIADGLFRTSYRGVTMGLLGMFPYSAIDMGTFELLKSGYTKYKAKYYNIHEEDAIPGNIATGFIGASSGAFGATVVYPLNVMRTRLQTQGTAMHPPTYTGIVDVAQKTWRNEGFRGMYKGLTPNLLKVAPALSITWVVYENSKRLLGLH